MATKNPYRHDGKSYDLTVDDVAELANRTVRWVYSHAERFGGVKRAWLAESTGNQRSTIRFNKVAVNATLKSMALKPRQLASA